MDFFIGAQLLYLYPGGQQYGTQGCWAPITTASSIHGEAHCLDPDAIFCDDIAQFSLLRSLKENISAPKELPVVCI